MLYRAMIVQQVLAYNWDGPSQHALALIMQLVQQNSCAFSGIQPVMSLTVVLVDLCYTGLFV